MIILLKLQLEAEKLEPRIHPASSLHTRVIHVIWRRVPLHGCLDVPEDKSIKPRRGGVHKKLPSIEGSTLINPDGPFGQTCDAEGSRLHWHSYANHQNIQSRDRRARNEISSIRDSPHRAQMISCCC